VITRDVEDEGNARMKRIIISSLVVLFGIVAIAGGFSKLGDTTVRCGGRIMQSGDECVSTSTTGSETGRKSVDEQQSSDKAGTWAAMGGGLLIVVFGGKSLWTGIRNRRKKPGEGTPVGNQASQAGPAGHQPPAGSAQYQPQQAAPAGYQPQQAAWNQQAAPAGQQPQQPAWNQPQQAEPAWNQAQQAGPAWNQPPQQYPPQQNPPQQNPPQQNPPQQPQPGWGPPPQR
jgi:hypothetical protein